MKLIIWLKNDLRVKDNPLFIYASKNNYQVIPLFTWSPEEEGDWQLGAASKLWLHHSLKKLQQELKEKNLNLIIKNTSSIEALQELLQESKAEKIIWNFRFEPKLRKRDKKIKKDLEKQGIDTQIFNGSSLFDPSQILNKSAKAFKVFTPYYKYCLNLAEEAIEQKYIKELSTKLNFKTSEEKISSLKIEDLNLLDSGKKWNHAWQEALTSNNKHFQVGEKAALKKLKSFLKTAQNYDNERDRVDLEATSQLSQHLHFGEISPYRIWKESQGCESFCRQLIWREFAHYILYHFDYSCDKNFNDKFNNFPWQKNKALLESWQKGKTGYPIVDAGMQELWHTGIMHNRVRMIVGSFLVKHLMIHWKEGAKWFWDTLIDANLANNSMGWQWVAGSGVDASPYFRIFNPIIQGEKFDPQGKYIKKWLPQLSKLDTKWLNKPFEAPPLVLEEAGVELGKNYPYPLVSHKEAREKALRSFKAMTRS